MKKRMILLGMAVATLASCTNEEVMEMAENRAIGFTTFVNNNTRTADITNADISAFWVFGNYADDPNTVNVFNNVKVNGTGAGEANSKTWSSEQTAYWQKDKIYQFAAYANGTAKLETGVAFDPAGKTLKFTAYSVGDNDLIAGLATGKSWNGTDTPEKVAFSFKHMLSKITFTFKTKAADTYIMNVTGLKIALASNVSSATGAADPVKTANGSLGTNDATPVSWETTTNTTTGEYTYEEISDYADGTADASGYFSKSTTGQYVIPQANENLYATFTVKMSSQGTDQSGNPITVELGSRTFTVSLKYASGETAEPWKPGMHYNYIAEVNPDHVTDDMKPIEFTVQTVDGWKDPKDITTEPIKVNP